MPLRLLIVEDQRMFREGIRSRLDMEADLVVVGEATSAEEGLELVEHTKPTVVILYIRLPGMSGIEAARVMRQKWPELKILMLTGYDFDQYVRAAARAGIDGYILKDASQDKLVQALREIAAGGAVLPPSIASIVMRSYSKEPGLIRRPQPDELTVREIEVLELMSQGLRNTEIAQHLSISIRTVEAHVSKIMSKLGAQSRTEAVRVAIQKNLIK